MDEVGKSFSSTAKFLFGTELAPLAAYVQWLERGLPFAIVEHKSRLSGKQVFMVPHPAYVRIMGNVADIDEALEVGKKALNEQEVESLSLANAANALAGISTTSPNIVWRENFDTAQSACYGPTQHCYRIAFSWWDKYCSCSYDVRTCSHVHGCSELDDCNFCIKCHQSSKLQRCFEVDESSNCSDCYFCHNVENCHDCMFCFNAKNLKNAIGNAQYPREDYLRIKKMVLAEIGARLEKDKKLPWDIYSIGARKS